MRQLAPRLDRSARRGAAAGSPDGYGPSRRVALPEGRMSSFGDKAKQVISTVAPLLGGALGGPLGAAAGSFIAKELGGVDPKAAEKAILSGDPQTLLALKKVETDFRQHLA